MLKNSLTLKSELSQTYVRVRLELEFFNISSVWFAEIGYLRKVGGQSSHFCVLRLE